MRTCLLESSYSLIIHLLREPDGFRGFKPLLDLWAGSNRLEIRTWSVRMRNGRRGIMMTWVGIAKSLPNSKQLPLKIFIESLPWVVDRDWEGLPRNVFDIVELLLFRAFSLSNLNWWNPKRISFHVERLLSFLVITAWMKLRMAVIIVQRGISFVLYLTSSTLFIVMIWIATVSLRCFLGSTRIRESLICLHVLLHGRFDLVHH